MFDFIEKLMGTEKELEKHAPMLREALPLPESVKSMIPEGPSEDAQRPLTKEETLELQQSLNSKGYNTGTADGIYGSNTEAGVKAYVADAGITGTFDGNKKGFLDIVREDTHNQSEVDTTNVPPTFSPEVNNFLDLINNNATYEDREGIKQIQTFINNNGGNLVVDGILGDKTRQGIVDTMQGISKMSQEELEDVLVKDANRTNDVVEGLPADQKRHIVGEDLGEGTEKTEEDLGEKKIGEVIRPYFTKIEGAEAHVGGDSNNLTLPWGIVADSIEVDGKRVKAGKNTLSKKWVKENQDKIDYDTAVKEVNGKTFDASDYYDYNEYFDAVVEEYGKIVKKALPKLDKKWLPSFVSFVWNSGNNPASLRWSGAKTTLAEIAKPENEWNMSNVVAIGRHSFSKKKPNFGVFKRRMMDLNLNLPPGKKISKVSRKTLYKTVNTNGQTSKQVFVGVEYSAYDESGKLIRTFKHNKKEDSKRADGTNPDREIVIYKSK